MPLASLLGSQIAVVGDAIPAPLTALPGDPRQGRAIVVKRKQGQCLLCHSGPFPEEATPGDGPTSLAGVGSRWSESQLRLPLADMRVLNPATVKPSFHCLALDGRVAPAFAGRPILSAQEVEIVVTFPRSVR